MGAAANVSCLIYMPCSGCSSLEYQQPSNRKSTNHWNFCSAKLWAIVGRRTRIPRKRIQTSKQTPMMPMSCHLLYCHQMSSRVQVFWEQQGINSMSPSQRGKWKIMKICSAMGQGSDYVQQLVQAATDSFVPRPQVI